MALTQLWEQAQLTARLVMQAQSASLLVWTPQWHATQAMIALLRELLIRSPAIQVSTVQRQLMLVPTLPKINTLTIMRLQSQAIATLATSVRLDPQSKSHLLSTL